MLNRDFWAEQRVFLTGHTGFKGSWMAMWLSRLGATVHGIALAPDTTPNLHSLVMPIDGLHSTIDDIRDAKGVAEVVRACNPTIAIHMAAQPLVRRSYREPLATYETNVMGTLHVLDALRRASSLKAILVVTTDKVYKNDESGRSFKEDDVLGGHDPYSSSKAACEEVVSCYAQSYFDDAGVAVATARAGNVIGGGDWSEDRLVPDIWRAMQKPEPIVLRNPESTRPWLHVLEPVSGYLCFAEALASERGRDLPKALNFGPFIDKPLTVRAVTEILAESFGLPEPWRQDEGFNPVEMKLLALDPSLAKVTLGWQPLLNGRKAVQWTADWYLNHHEGRDSKAFTTNQIAEYEIMLGM